MMDIMLDDNMDLMIGINGDFVIDNPFVQDQLLLCETDKNDWKENPEIGIGLDNYLEDEDDGEMNSEIREQYVMAGMQVEKIIKEAKKIIVIRKK